jgi:hypothetical protein
MTPATLLSFDMVSGIPSISIGKNVRFVRADLGRWLADRRSPG